MTWVKLIVRDFADASAFVSQAHSQGLQVLIGAQGSRAKVMDEDYQNLWVAYLGNLAAAGALAVLE